MVEPPALGLPTELWQNIGAQVMSRSNDDLRQCDYELLMQPFSGPFR